MVTSNMIGIHGIGVCVGGGGGGGGQKKQTPRTEKK